MAEIEAYRITMEEHEKANEELAQDQRGIAEELASARSTSRMGMFPRFVIKGRPQVVFLRNYGRADAILLHNNQDRRFQWCR